MKHTLKTLAIVAASFLLGNYAHAQTTNTAQKADYCGTEVPSQEWEDNFQKLIKEYSSRANKTQALYTIPVVIHVIHGGEPVGSYPNLAQGQLHSQIQVLNEDFAGIGYNSGNYPANAFANWAVNENLPVTKLDGIGRVRIADCGIQFCMATKDPQGNTLAEPGIDRVNYVSKNWTNPGSFNSTNTFRNYMDGTIKPGTIWDVTKYLNIWVSDVKLSTVSLLGYATFPPQTGLSGLNSSLGTTTTDGFWSYARAFGSAATFPNGHYDSGNNRGRTSTHEIGHWVGLRHIWGDGNCVTDYCADTPPASDRNFGGATYPHKVGSCSSNSPDGEMYMNFMDYVDDANKYMFSPDQATRVQTAMSNSPFRKFLGTHNLCSVENIASTAAFSLPTSICGSYAFVAPGNASQGVPAPTYTWSGSSGVTFSPSPNDRSIMLDISTPGNHTITLTTNNGTTSTISKTINVIPFPVVAISIPSTQVCIGETLSFTVTGGNFYGWQPSSRTGSVVNYVASSTQVFTVVATGVGSCKSTETIEIEVGDCYVGIEENLNNSNALITAYPNPVGNKLILNTHLASNTDKLSVEIFDISGKLILTQNASVNGFNAEVNTSTIAPGIYLLKLTRYNQKPQMIKLIKE